MRGTPQERFWAKVSKDGPVPEGQPQLGPCWLWTASTRPCNDRTYGQFGIGGRNFYAHRLAYEWAFGSIPPGEKVDHRCHNSMCVNPAHLRRASQKQNLENRRGLNSNNTSGHRGVYYMKRERRWCACVSDGDMVWRRYFATREEAAIAVVEMRNRHFTHHTPD